MREVVSEYKPGRSGPQKFEPNFSTTGWVLLAFVVGAVGAIALTGWQDAAKAVAALGGRTFDGRQVVAEYFDEAKFAAKQYD